METYLLLDFLKNSAGQIFLADETALYYTFSTIAQTLAGSFAMLGAFVLFKIQSLNEGFRNLYLILSSVPLHFKSEEDTYYLEDWNTYIYEFEKAYQKESKSRNFNTKDISIQDIERHIATFKKNLQLKTRLSGQIYLTFFITAITIILSLIFLPLIPTQIHRPFMNFVSVITLLLSGICICLYGKILMTALELRHVKVIQALALTWKSRLELRTKKKKQKPKDD
jgi:hypothetical protein